VEHLFDPTSAAPRFDVRPPEEDEGMAAVIQLHRNEGAGAQHSALPTRPPRPRLVVLEGGRSAERRHLRRVFLVRRALVLTIAVGLVWAGALLLGGILGGSTGAGASAPVASTVVVRPGQTLWQIAEGLHRGGDIRDVVDRLAEFNGTASLVPGQVVRVPLDLAS
jgi:hypothetical protein